jgi:hypothetical protein
MARRDELLELLRPPAHRGPLIAAGAVLFTVGIALEEQRLDEQLPNGIHVLIVAAAAALILGLGLQARPEAGAPAAYQSVLLVSGLLLLGGALLELANLLGADFSGDELPAGAFVWTSLLLCAAALYPAVRRNSAICGMVAALALGIAILSAANWIFGADSQAVYRWLLLALAVAFVLASLVLRGGSPRHAELMVITAGLATLAIALVASAGALFGALAGFGSGDEGFLPGFWELVVLVAGCGLIAYGAVDRVPGAAWLGLAHLVAFLAAASAGADDTLLWWPLILLALGGGVLAAGLRPRRPLPPEPAGYSVERPLASRTDDISMSVRNDDPPPR